MCLWLIGAALEEILRLICPKLRHVCISLDRYVHQYIAQDRMLYFLQTCDIDVLYRVVICIKLQWPTRRLNLHSTHRL